MGNPKQKWTAEEEEALRAGVAKHGAGKWKLMLTDPQLHAVLHSRSNIDLKDKWRNMNVAVLGSRDKLRTPKPKPTHDAPASSLITPVPIIHESPGQHVKDDSAMDLPNGKNGPRYNKVNFEAVSAGKEQSGLDISSTSSYIEQRIEEPQNFGKPLGASLERHVQQDELEKDDSLYWLKNNPMETNTSNWIEEAAKSAAFKVAEAETKSYAAAEAAKEAEKFSKLAEETDSALQFAKEIFNRCTHGEMVLVA